MVDSPDKETAKLLDRAAEAYVARELAWLSRGLRGRWLVLEAGPRDIPCNLLSRRARRFTSLSRARSFARTVKGTVHHWRRSSPAGGTWKIQSPWQRALESSPEAVLGTVFTEAP
jgi:hypothetical protein